jgi:DNA polymerase V
MILYALVDCNNFYVSCERVFAPKLIKRPVVVLSNNDRCVIARSEEAKRLGIGMGVPVFQIRNQLACHGIRTYSSNYTLYGDMSRRVVNTLKTFTEDIEAYSIDESFLEFHLSPYEDLIALGQAIKKRVIKWTGIPVCVGFGPTKTLAKVANRLAKKQKETGGVFDLCEHKRRDAILKTVDIEDVWGIGRQYAKLLRQNEIKTAYHLTLKNDTWVLKRLTVLGLRLKKELQGIRCLSLEQTPPPKKSIGRSRAFGRSVSLLPELKSAVASYVASAARALRKQASVTGCLQVHIETGRSFEPYHNDAITIRLHAPTASTPDLIHCAFRGLQQIFREGCAYYRAGVMLMDIGPMAGRQADCFAPDQYPKKKQVLMNLVDDINAKFGRNTLQFAAEGLAQKWHMKQFRRSKHFTTNWKELRVIHLSK